jgi:hypothetical protein
LHSAFLALHTIPSRDRSRGFHLDGLGSADYAWNFMKTFTLAGLIMVTGLLAVSRAIAADSATLFWVFLKDGTTLVSYGEFARVGDRLVFSMPTDAARNPTLQLVNIPESRVDWVRTTRYAEEVRSTQYLGSQAESDYAALSNEISETLNEVTRTPDPAKRLTMVERARKTLADWPRSHYNYRSSDVRQMLTLLDEAIADLRAAAGQQRFDLTLAATTEDPPAPVEPMAASLTPKEAIEQTLAAAEVVDAGPQRSALLAAALASIDRNASRLPSAWATSTRAETKAALVAEQATDRAYQSLATRVMAAAQSRAAFADVKGLEQLLRSIRRQDGFLGEKRPETIDGLLAAVQAQLDAARRLQLERDRWLLRAPALREYRAAIATPVTLFEQLRPALDNIKSLAGSTPASLAFVHSTVARIVKLSSAIVPPDELSAAHALLMSAAQMADNAARIRYDATLSSSMALAWDASSAAAGALMLAAQAQSDLQSAMRPPRLQ